MGPEIKTIRFGGRLVGPGQPPFIVAEMSGNHNGSLERALKIVDAAADAGAHAVKIQTYTADTMTLNLNRGAFMIRDPKSLWKGYSLHKLYQRAFTPWKWHTAIFDRCRKRGLIGFSTPFDMSAVKFLESLHVPLYKVASFENIDLPLIRKIASLQKPVIISTGMASAAEIDEAVQAARAAGAKELVLLKCTSSYPASPKESNLRTIPHLRELFHCPVGLSDHTLGMGASIAAIALGACVLERHFTLSRADGGVDSAFSLEPHELKQLVIESRVAWEALGGIHYGPTQSERGSLQHRRSLYITKDVKAGEKLTRANLRSVRPGLGLPPKYFDMVLGKRANRDLRRGTPLKWSMIG
jgi:N-acetylneuraminate synthase